MKPTYFQTTGDATAVSDDTGNRRFMVLDAETFLRATAEHLGIKVPETTLEAIAQFITSIQDKE